MSGRQIGTQMEEKAAIFLEQNQVRIVDKNFRSKAGEIDLIGYHKGYLVFFEVKYRRNHHCGLPEEAVDWKKQCKICKVSDYYRYRKKVSMDTPIRYDVLAISGQSIKWYQNAFEYRC